MQNKFKETILTMIKRWWSDRKIIVIGIIVIVALLLNCPLTYYLRVVRGLVWADWTGFEEKKLWDALELLIVPAVLGFGALLINKLIRDNEQRRTIEQQQEDALQNHLDKMEELLLEEKLLENKDYLGEAVVKVAQVRTVTTLKVLDKDRRDILIQFLRDSNLADFILVGAPLAEVDLSETILYFINLVGANLYRANLQGADLQEATLIRAFLVEANLQGSNLLYANLQECELQESNLKGANLEVSNLSDAKLQIANLAQADLYSANLQGANLSEADLRGAKLKQAILRGTFLGSADLRGADLRAANLTEADLRGANLEAADLRRAIYNSQTEWPDGFDYINSGAVGPGADLRGVDLRGIDLTETDLWRANLEEADLVGANYDDNTDWPEDFDIEKSGAKHADNL